MLGYDLPWIATGAQRVPGAGLLVGVDAGATKTLALGLHLGTGEIRTAVAASGNADSVGVDAANREVTAAVLRVAGSDEIEQAVVAVAGTNPEYIVEALNAQSSLSPENLEVVNDVVAAWAVVDYCQDAIAIIAGTGSHTLGVLDGRAVRVGGWGHVFGDEGSAYWMGREAVSAAARYVDGRGDGGDLVRALLASTGDASVPDLVGRLYAQGALKHEIASLARVVDQAAQAGDQAAQAITTAAAVVLYEHLQTLQAHDERHADLPVGLVGSAWHSAALRASFEQLVEPRRGAVAMISTPPALGALAIAAVASGHDREAVRARAEELADRVTRS